MQAAQAKAVGQCNLVTRSVAKECKLATHLEAKATGKEVRMKASTRNLEDSQASKVQVFLSKWLEEKEDSLATLLVEARTAASDSRLDSVDMTTLLLAKKVASMAKWLASTPRSSNSGWASVREGREPASGVRVAPTILSETFNQHYIREGRHVKGLAVACRSAPVSRGTPFLNLGVVL
mmetsp:Transcript_143077/g.260183  ORF Transcript_143077/g.260183 Transcript_143077/m.260183 type:complete len:179 (+) Transcript_143077:1238-1774(+)